MRLKSLISLVLLSTLTANASFAEGERAGDFDYYVLALSWSPNWCALEGDDRNSPQCDDDADFGWVMHGLWPQYHRGWPSYCNNAARPPSRSMTAAMADIMGTSGSAWYQWKKHGTCAGLSAEDFYDTARTAYDSINRPALLRKLDKQVTLPASLIEEAFLKDNPQLEADGVTVTCRSNRIQEVRICLSKDLDPIKCGSDVIKDCTAKSAVFDPIR